MDVDIQQGDQTANHETFLKDQHSNVRIKFRR